MYGDIILYSTGCPLCNVLKKKLDGKNISYTECTSTEEMISKEITRVPVLNNNGVCMEFDEAVEWVNKQ